MTQDANKQGMPRKRLVAIIVALVLALAVVGVTAWFLLPGDTGPRDPEAGETALLQVKDRNGSGQGAADNQAAEDQKSSTNNSASDASSVDKDADRIPGSGDSGSSSEGSQDSGDSGDQADEGSDEGDSLTGHFVAPTRDRDETEFIRKW